jgi:hypothetical protein
MMSFGQPAGFDENLLEVCIENQPSVRMTASETNIMVSP